MPSGLYLVALRNDEPISVNAHDMRIADRCIWVNRLNCKLGKAKCLQSRQRNYERTFGAANVIFNPYALLTEITEAEKLVLRKVDAFRVRGRTNLKNEWLTGIDPQEALKLAVCALEESGCVFRVIRPPISRRFGHLFRCNPATHFRAFGQAVGA